jgi:DNA (cytosine-5)-methyltransferase 3A
MGWALFMRFVDALWQIQPRYFLYENVASMPKSIRDYISDELGCAPILINSALVSAQHRKRLYWSNIEGISQPNDKGILLKDILESGIASQDKSQTILATLYKENALSMVKRQKTGLYVSEAVDVGAALRTRADENGSFKRLEVRGDGKLNALTTVQTDSVICSPVRLGSIGAGGIGHRVYSVQGKTVTLRANGGGRGALTGLYRVDLPDGDYTVRKLSVIEAERCQTLPDNYTAIGIDDSGKTIIISNTQRYKAIGNGWTVDVIAHILSHMAGGDDQWPMSKSPVI